MGEREQPWARGTKTRKRRHKKPHTDFALSSARIATQVKDYTLWKVTTPEKPETKDLTSTKYPIGPKRKDLPRQPNGLALFKVMPSDQRLRAIRGTHGLPATRPEAKRIFHRFELSVTSQKKRLDALVCEDLEERKSQFNSWKSLLHRVPGSSYLGTQPAIDIPLGPRAAARLKTIQDCTSVQEFITQMPHINIGLKGPQRDVDLVPVSLLLRYAPEKLDWMLQYMLSSSPGASHFFVIEDILDILVQRLRHMPYDERETYAAHLANLVVWIVEMGRLEDVSKDGQPRISQANIYFILEALNVSEIWEWYDKLSTLECHLGADVQLHFATRLSTTVATKHLSVHVMRDLVESGQRNINDPVPSSVCTSILTFTDEDLKSLDDKMATPADLFRHLHYLGLVPNVITYTALIRSLCLKRDIRTAMEVFTVMKAHQVVPDATTYTVLLHGCKLAGDYETLCDLAIEACHNNIRDYIVWNEVLHAVFICCQREFLGQIQEVTRQRRQAHLPFDISMGVPRAGWWAAVNALFSRLFDPSMLRPFIMGDVEDAAAPSAAGLSKTESWFPAPLRRILHEIPSLQPEELLQTRSETLGVMILAFVRSLPAPPQVVAFYAHYRRLLLQGHPVAKLLVEERGSLVHDIVLWDLLKWPIPLRVALDIIKEMTHSAPTGHSNMTDAARSALLIDEWDAPVRTEEPGTNDSGRAPIPHPPPSVYTWSILIHGFMRHKQPRQAEQVLRLMREHGIEPNEVTWNIMVAGYAKMQRVNETVDAMRQLEAHGFKADDWTMRAFNKLHNKRAAIKLLETTVKANEARQKADAEAEEEQRDAETEDEWNPETDGKWQAFEAAVEQARAKTPQGAADEDVMEYQWHTRLSEPEPEAPPLQSSDKIIQELQERDVVEAVKSSSLATWDSSLKEHVDTLLESETDMKPKPADG